MSYGKVLLALAAAAACASAQMEYDHGKIVSCYYSTWAYYRPGIGQFDVDNFDPSLCSHGFYGFADLDNITNVIAPYDINFDLCPEQCPEGEVCQYCGYSRFTALKDEYPHFIPVVSIGGWNAGSGEYSLMAKDPEKMDSFVNSIVPFLELYGFEGLDVDWEYPGSREGADIDVDKANFVELSRRLAEVLHEKGYILTMAIAAGVHTAEIAYDIPAIVDYYDFFNVMTYDYHGWFPPDETFLGQNAPIRLYDAEKDPTHPGYQHSFQDIVTYYLEQGMPVEKMVMGTPTYGRGLHMPEPDCEEIGTPCDYDPDAEDDDGTRSARQEDKTYQTGFYCPGITGFPMGPYTRQSGHYGYLEVLQLYYNDTLSFMPDAIAHEWTRVWDECYQSPHMYDGPYWLGYDDEESVRVKAAYANSIGAGGVMIWSIETDDFGAFYSQRTYPLLRTINEVLVSGETFDITADEACRTTPDDWCDFLQDLQDACSSEDIGQQLPYPGTCHDYYYCIPTDDTEETFVVQPYTCNEKVFDPISQNCIDPNLPGTDNLCGGIVDA